MKNVALASLVVLTACVTDVVPHEHEAEHGPVFVAQDDDLLGSLADDEEGWSVTPVLEARTAANRVGFRFDAATPVAVQVRASTDGGETFGPWIDATITWSEEIAHNARADVGGGATHAQLRFLAPVEAGLTFLAVEMFAYEEPLEDEEGFDVVDESADHAGLAADGIAVTRSQWGARTRNCSGTHSPSKLTVHHTDTPNNDSISMPARMRQIQAFHIDGRGWCDIGYHFLIGQDGKVYQGRVENKIGAHAANANQNNVGISFIGNYASNAPSASMMTAAARIMKSMSTTYGIALNRDKVKGHRQVGTTSTSCPGQALYDRLQALIDEATGAAEQPTTQEPTPTEPTPTPTEPSDGTFGDVPSTHSAYAAIEELAAAGVFTGCGGGNFCPDEPITRAQLAVAFAALMSSSYTTSSKTFADVSTSAATWPAIKETYSRGIITECSGGGFCPVGLVTRAGMAVFVQRAKDLAWRTPATPTFGDVSRSHWAYGGIEAVANAGYVVGCRTSPRAYCPSDLLTRASAAVILANAF